MKQEGKKKSEQVKTGMCVSVWVTECVCVCVRVCVERTRGNAPVGGGYLLVPTSH